MLIKRIPRTSAQVLAQTWPSSYRLYTSSPSKAAEGDLGSVRSGGQKAGDTFQRREHAIEESYFYKKELETLKRLQAKLAEHKKHLEEASEHVEEMVTHQESLIGNKTGSA